MNYLQNLSVPLPTHPETMIANTKTLNISPIYLVYNKFTLY